MAENEYLYVATLRAVLEAFRASRVWQQMAGLFIQ